jgi:hypothetical protein
MFTNFLDTRFTGEVEIGNPILQGKTALSGREVVQGPFRGAERVWDLEMTAVIT